MAKTDDQRLLDLKAARKGVRKGQTILLKECAALWGVSKPRFVNKRAEIADFPEPDGMDGNAHTYPKREALTAMINYIEGHKKQSAKKVAKTAKLIGAEPSMTTEGSSFSITELRQANVLRADIEEGKRKQGEYTPMADVMAVATVVFSEFSEFASNLANACDPHGRFPPEIRAAIEKNAEEQLRMTHRNLRRYLTDDVDSRPARKRNSRSRRPQA